MTLKGNSLQTVIGSGFPTNHSHFLRRLRLRWPGIHANLALRIAVVSIGLLFNSMANSHTGISSDSEGQLSVMVKQAQLVFLGQIVDVTYRNERVGEKGNIPVTYVTYAIEEVVRGKPSDRKITVRFLGGSDGRGGFLSLSSVPEFQVKERDVVLLSGNGLQGCPLVNCEDGRFRVHEGGVYNAHGVPVRALTKEGVISRGQMNKAFSEFRYPTPKFDELMRNPEAKKTLEEMKLSMDEARKRYQQEAPREIIVRRVVSDRSDQQEKENSENSDGKAIVSTDEPLQEGPIAIEEFLAHLQKLSEKAGKADQRIASLKVGQPAPIKFTGPEKPVVQPFSKSMSQEDEERLIGERDGNPVIKQ